MKLSELNNYINELKQSQDSVNDKLTQIAAQLSKTLNENKQILENLKLLDSEIIDIKERLQTYNYFHLATDYTKNVKNKLADNIIDELCTRFSIYSDCNYPSLYIGNEPRLSNALIAADPLYIASWDNNVMDSIKSQYNKVYQKKLLIYNLTKNDFSELALFPFNQFRCIICWDVINFLSVPNARVLLYKFLLLLRPGGTVFFNFNNCDKQHLLIKAENYEIPYQTVQDLHKNLQKYMIMDFSHTNFNDDIDYIKITKNGDLQTIKAQPVLGEIIPKAS